MKGFNPIAKLMQEVREFMKATTTKLDAIIETQKQHTALLQQHTALLQQLISEVSRYKNDSDELLVSVYAFCTQEKIPFTHNDLYRWGGQAMRLSKREGFKVEKTNDPRFGKVGLYERQVLESIVGVD